MWDKLVREFPLFGKHCPTMPIERQTAKACGDFSQVVGTSNGNRVEYDLLVEKPKLPPLKVPPEFRQMGWEDITNEQLNLALQIGDKRIEWINRARRGFCGWLMTNRTFLAEHDGLFRAHAPTILTFGSKNPRLPGLSTTQLQGFIPGAQAANRHQAAFAQAMQKFCERWHLSDMAGPYLPVHYGVLSPAVTTNLLTPSMQNCGVTIYLPYIYAIPTEDELRALVADALGGKPKFPHLTGWFKIIEKKAANKGIQMRRYGRLFEMQHYRRLLHERYPQIMHRGKQKLIYAFAGYLRQSADTIKYDLRQIEAAAIANPMRTWDLK